MLGVPVVPISAAKNEGVDELVRHALHIAKYQERPGRQDFCDESDFGGAVHRCIHAVAHLIEDHAKETQIPLRFAASKIIEGDHLILEKLHLDENEKEAIEHLIVQMEKERGLDRSAAIADMRFTFIEKVCEKTVVKPKESRERIRSEKIDRILTGKYTAIPCFIGIMLIVFYLTFHVIGAGLQNLLQMGIDALTAAVDGLLSTAGVNEVLHDLVINGWKYFKFSADRCDTVFLPVLDGGQWIYCPCCFLYGQTFEKDRALRKKYCSNADRFWLYSSGCYGNPDAAK